MAGFGETLRQARALKNVTLREAETETRINRHYLAALEDEEFGALPPPIYSRGIVRKYADYLGLDAGKVLDMHRELTGASHEPGLINTTQAEMPRMWTPNFAIMAFGVVLTAIVFAWGYSIWLSPPENLDALPTATVTSTIAAAQTGDEPRPTAPAAPTAVVTEAPVVVAGGDNQSGEVVAPETFRTGIGITVTGDAYLTIEVDGQVVYDDMLTAGSSTDMFVGSDFSVTTSDASVSFFFNSCGITSGAPMDANSGSFTQTFSASSASCAPPEG